jgi:rod shape-determining protein MreB
VFGRLFPVRPLYVQISSDRLRVSKPNTDRVFEDKPIVAIDHSGRRPKVVGFGTQVEHSPYTLVRPFSHGRLLVHEFEAASKLLKHAFAYVAGRSLLRSRPVAVVHPLDTPEDGLTDIEDRVFRELALSAGAKRVYLWQGRKLTSMELLNGAFRDAA